MKLALDDSPMLRPPTWPAGVGSYRSNGRLVDKGSGCNRLRRPFLSLVMRPYRRPHRHESRIKTATGDGAQSSTSAASALRTRPSLGILSSRIILANRYIDKGNSYESDRRARIEGRGERAADVRRRRDLPTSADVVGRIRRFTRGDKLATADALASARPRRLTCRRQVTSDPQTRTGPIRALDALTVTRPAARYLCYAGEHASGW
ncbi:hypothetical protein EVAR_60582_1 [Eumeta japonica]|uniref:Uncharacterized protein n=1 Tax=Eumeta variegata TaxID=151549 RepID=A0A4C1YHZ8_EUMVA|nr:hypothetical protein EVAR_60582_1 [Eumeta japonica]